MDIQINSGACNHTDLRHWNNDCKQKVIIKKIIFYPIFNIKLIRNDSFTHKKRGEKMKKLLIAGLLAIPAVFAQLTGDYGRAIGMGMYGGTEMTAARIIWGIFSVGITIAVWLWVIKLWKEVRKMK